MSGGTAPTPHGSSARCGPGSSARVHAPAGWRRSTAASTCGASRSRRRRRRSGDPQDPRAGVTWEGLDLSGAQVEELRFFGGRIRGCRFDGAEPDRAADVREHGRGLLVRPGGPAVAGARRRRLERSAHRVAAGRLRPGQPAGVGVPGLPARGLHVREDDEAAPDHRRRGAGLHVHRPAHLAARERPGPPAAGRPAGLLGRPQRCGAPGQQDRGLLPRRHPPARPGRPARGAALPAGDEGRGVLPAARATTARPVARAAAVLGQWFTAPGRDDSDVCFDLGGFGDDAVAAAVRRAVAYAQDKA